MSGRGKGARKTKGRSSAPRSSNAAAISAAATAAAAQNLSSGGGGPPASANLQSGANLRAPGQTGPLSTGPAPSGRPKRVPTPRAPRIPNPRPAPVYTGANVAPIGNLSGTAGQPGGNPAAGSAPTFTRADMERCVTATKEIVTEIQDFLNDIVNQYGQLELMPVAEQKKAAFKQFKTAVKDLSLELVLLKTYHEKYHQEIPRWEINSSDSLLRILEQVTVNSAAWADWGHYLQSVPARIFGTDLLPARFQFLQPSVVKPTKAVKRVVQSSDSSSSSSDSDGDDSRAVTVQSSDQTSSDDNPQVSVLTHNDKRRLPKNFFKPKGKYKFSPGKTFLDFA